MAIDNPCFFLFWSGVLLFLLWTPLLLFAFVFERLKRVFAFIVILFQLSVLFVGIAISLLKSSADVVFVAIDYTRWAKQFVDWTKTITMDGQVKENEG